MNPVPVARAASSSTATASSDLHVAVGVLVDPGGRTLLMRRLPGTHMAGRWEFPGGKLLAGESVLHALQRELVEELGIVPLDPRPLIRVRHDYPGRRVLLDCWRIERWQGAPRAREGHRIEWVAPSGLPGYDLLEADRPILAALGLPARYAISAWEADPALALAGIERLLAAGHTLLQLRAPVTGVEYEGLAASAGERCRGQGARLLLNTTPARALALDAAGVQLDARTLMALDHRPLEDDRLVGASCHDAAELAHARAIGCDFATLGPVSATRSHPGAAPLGWARFAELADCAGLPVYALGGLGDADLASAWSHHGQGVAAIRAWWGTR